MKKLILIILLLVSGPVVFGQYDYGFDVTTLNTGSCTTPSVYKLQGYSQDPTVQSFGIKVYWEDGAVEHYPEIPVILNSWAGSQSDTIILTHQFQFFRDYFHDIHYDVFINGETVPVGSGLIDIQISLLENSTEEFLFPQMYVYDSIGYPTDYDSLYLDINTNNGINATLFFESPYTVTLNVCPQTLPFQLSMNTEGNNNHDVQSFNLPVVVQNSSPFGSFGDNVTDFENNLYTASSFNFLLIGRNTSTLENTNLLNASSTYSYYDTSSVDYQSFRFFLNRTENAMPDTNLVIHIDNPGNALVFETSYVKNAVVGDEFFEFQPKPADHLRKYLTIGLAMVNGDQLNFGDNFFNAYLKNTNDVDLGDDTTTLILNYFEPCIGNNSTEIDLGLNCQKYAYDTLVLYQLEITKQTCQDVPGVGLTIHHPSSMTPIHNYSYMDSLVIVNDSTIHITFDFEQYSFYHQLMVPFTFNGNPFSGSTLDFSSELSCDLDTNGVEICEQQLDLSDCNQIDTAYSTYTVDYLSDGTNTFILNGAIEYFNCYTSDTLKVRVAVPSGVFPISNTLSNAAFSNDTLRFDLSGSNFYLQFGTNQNLLGQNVLFTVSYSNNSDTTLSNNTSFLNYQMPPDMCLEFSHDVYSCGYFDYNAHQFVINHFSNRYLCYNTVQEKITFSNNIVPVIDDLVNPIVNGNTLTFDLPDTSYYSIKFNYNQFSALQTESFHIEYLLSSDTILADNFDSLNIDFPFAVCDTISVIENTYSFSSLIAPLQTGTISLYTSVLNCSNELQATFTLPSWITPEYAQIPGAIYQNNQLTIPSINGYSENQFSFNVTFPGNTPAGTLVDIPYVLQNGLDNSLFNNMDTIHGTVVNSYDPNEKLSNQKEQISPDVKDAFVYEIHFQNDGNFPAYNITVKDTVDVNLDLRSIRLLSSKHSCMMQVDSINRLVSFVFPNIMLASSELDSLGSQGVFRYSIQELPEVANGEAIENTAFIYFDFNDPIVTNTTSSTNAYINTIESISEDILLVYPNPANEQIQLGDFELLSQIKITDMKGQVIFNQNDFQNGILNVSEVPNGIYMINAMKNGHGMHQKITINH